MRGIRVLQGNIEVGDEYFLADMFTERRFSTWNIGEIHLNYALKLNARRDGFEPSAQYEVFLEQSYGLARFLSQLCRRSSKDRSRLAHAHGSLRKLEAFVAGVIILDEQELPQTLSRVEAMLQKLEGADDDFSTDPGFRQRLATAKRRYEQIKHNPTYLRDILDGRLLRHLNQKQLVEHIARSVLEHYDSIATASELLAKIVAPYARPGSIRSAARRRT
jgi:hypothetical protein